MGNFKNILVATDFSSGAKAAVSQAVRLACLHEAKLHTIHVVPKGPRDGLVELVPDAYKDIDQRIRAAALDELRVAVQEAAGGVGMAMPELGDQAVIIGSPVREIVGAVERTSADLLVLGATGEGNRRLGTVAGRCVRKGPTRVLLVPSGRSGAFKKVVAAVDFGELTRPVVEQAARVAQLDGGSVTALHVYAPPWELARWGGMPADASARAQDAAAALERRFHEQVEQQAEAAFEGVDIKLELLTSSNDAECLIGFANDQEVDLVVTGTTGRSMLGYMLLGTTAEKLMRDTQCAVLALKR